MATTYVLKSQKDSKLYVGSTADLAKRIISHNSGKVRSTKGRRPFVLIYKEDFFSVTEARQRELFFKTGQGRKLLKELLEGVPNS